MINTTAATLRWEQVSAGHDWVCSEAVRLRALSQAIQREACLVRERCARTRQATEALIFGRSDGAPPDVPPLEHLHRVMHGAPEART